MKTNQKLIPPIVTPAALATLIFIICVDIAMAASILVYGKLDLAQGLFTFLLAHIAMTVFVTHFLRTFFPIIEGRFPAGSWQAGRWQAQAFVSLFGCNHFDIFIPFFLKPLWYRLYGAKIGKGVALSGRLIDCSLTEIKNNGGVGLDGVVLGHWVANNEFMIGKVVIGENATIGAKAMVFPGVTLGKNSTVAAMSLVLTNQTIHENEIWAGVPAKKISSTNHDLDI